MEHGIPALLVAAIMIVAALLVTRSGLTGVDALTKSFKEMETRTGAQARTKVDIITAASDAAGANVTATVKTNGSTVLGVWEATDVVVRYTGDGGAAQLRWLPYTAGALSPNTWKVNAIVNDVFEPDLLDPGEQMDIQMRINPVIGCGTTGTIVFTTEQGVTTSANVAGPPCP